MSTQSTHPDAKRSTLRTMVAEMDLAMADGATEPVRTAWRNLVTALELGPEPAVRKCPHCGRLGMIAASRCGYCWAALTPG